MIGFFVSTIATDTSVAVSELKSIPEYDLFIFLL